jgi:hypothetical protein
VRRAIRAEADRAATLIETAAEDKPLLSWRPEIHLESRNRPGVWRLGVGLAWAGWVCGGRVGLGVVDSS